MGWACLATFIVCVIIINLFADIDECLLNNTLCQQVCVNTDGSYFCDCMEGYQLMEGTNQCQGVWKIISSWCYRLQFQL
jgi:hypothetical protein